MFKDVGIRARRAALLRIVLHISSCLSFRALCASLTPCVGESRIGNLQTFPEKMVPLKQIEYGVYEDLIIIHPKAIFYLPKGDCRMRWLTLTPTLRCLGASTGMEFMRLGFGRWVEFPFSFPSSLIQTKLMSYKIAVVFIFYSIIAT